MNGKQMKSGFAWAAIIHSFTLLRPVSVVVIVVVIVAIARRSKRVRHGFGWSSSYC